MKPEVLFPAIEAVLAAALFGASAPLAKILLGKTDPILLAALLYLGSGLATGCFYLFGRLIGHVHVEARLEKKDIPWLMGAVYFGGVVAPILLMFSLKVTPAATASLLLNFESVATTLIAFLVFREAADRRVWLAVLCITGSQLIV